MKEAKFRAWDSAEKKWMDAEDIPFGTDGIEFSVGGWTNIVLMQFTGLWDKNGVEIYEGDILRIDIGPEDYPLLVPAVVSFESGAFWFRGDNFTDCRWFHYDDREVIGNVHEHPELVNGGRTERIK